MLYIPKRVAFILLGREIGCEGYSIAQLRSDHEVPPQREQSVCARLRWAHRNRPASGADEMLGMPTLKKGKV